MDKTWKWILIVVYAGFSVVYHKWGDPNSEAWTKAFYIWMCLVHVVMLIAICADCRDIFYEIYPLICYAIVRLVIEIATIYKPLEAVNDPLLCDILLYLCAAATSLLILKHRINEWYEKRQTKN